MDLPLSADLCPIDGTFCQSVAGLSETLVGAALSGGGRSLVSAQYCIPDSRSAFLGRRVGTLPAVQICSEISFGRILVEVWSCFGGDPFYRRRIGARPTDTAAAAPHRGFFDSLRRQPSEIGGVGPGTRCRHQRVSTRTCDIAVVAA